MTIQTDPSACGVVPLATGQDYERMVEKERSSGVQNWRAFQSQHPEFDSPLSFYSRGLGSSEVKALGIALGLHWHEAEVNAVAQTSAACFGSWTATQADFDQRDREPWGLPPLPERYPERLWKWREKSVWIAVACVWASKQNRGRDWTAACKAQGVLDWSAARLAVHYWWVIRLGYLDGWPSDDFCSEAEALGIEGPTAAAEMRTAVQWCEDHWTEIVEAAGGLPAKKAHPDG